MGENFCCMSFPASVGNDPKILILGSMPGRESLRQQQYYAFPGNAFWKLMGEFFHFDCRAPYAERLRSLNEHHIALWDSLHGCDRRGSLDSAITRPIPNAIDKLLEAHPGIERICCNGGAAKKFLLKFFPDLPVEILQLPSTSPAAAAIPYEEKRKRWHEALKTCILP